MNQDKRTTERTQNLPLLSSVMILLALLCGSVLRAEDPRTANREALVSDLTNLVLRAQDYYRRPASVGGGQFTGLSLGGLTATPVNSTGGYTLPTVASQYVVLHGVGTQKGTDGNNLSVDVTVFPDSISLWFNN